MAGRKMFYNLHRGRTHAISLRRRKKDEQNVAQEMQFRSLCRIFLLFFVPYQSQQYQAHRNANRRIGNIKSRPSQIIYPEI